MLTRTLRDQASVERRKKMALGKKAIFSSSQTAKLVEAHKVTDSFAAFACRDALKNEPPDPHKPETEEVEGGGSFFEVGKGGTNGKILDKNSLEAVAFLL